MLYVLDGDRGKLIARQQLSSIWPENDLALRRGKAIEHKKGTQTGGRCYS